MKKLNPQAITDTPESISADSQALHEAASRLGKVGGEGTLKRHGIEHYAAMGKKAAEQSPRPKEYYQQIGKLGAEAIRGKDHKEAGRKGGMKILETRGKEYYQEIGRKGREAQLKKREGIKLTKEEVSYLLLLVDMHSDVIEAHKTTNEKAKMAEPTNIAVKRKLLEEKQKLSA